ncbi:hypothetical protein FRB90_009571, partial [Tulasnella sp. 427]
MDSTLPTPTSPPSPTFNATLYDSTSSGVPFPLYGWLSVLFPMLRNPYILESLRLFFFGSVLETCRRICQWALDRFTSGFFVTAHFQQGDWAFDWLNEFLAAQDIWTNSREYRVTAFNLDDELEFNGPSRKGKNDLDSSSSDEEDEDEDGYPQAMYLPASDNTQVIRWRGHWVQVTRKGGGGMKQEGNGAPLTLSVTIYTRNKKILNRLVKEARLHYRSTQKPPLAAHMGRTNSGGGNLTVRATFQEVDYTYSWILEFLNSHNAWKTSNNVIVTAKSGER